jgi:hypothetical protein
MKRQKEVKIPNCCPQIDSCQETITKVEFDAVCNSANWVFCDKVLDENVAKYKRKPKEWSEA